MMTNILNGVAVLGVMKPEKSTYEGFNAKSGIRENTTLAFVMIVSVMFVVGFMMEDANERHSMITD